MKKLILSISILFIFCLSFQASAWNVIHVLSGSNVSTTCTQLHTYATTTSNWGVGQYVGRARGGTIYTPTTDREFCKWVISLKEIGDVSAQNIYVAIFATSGVNLTGSALGISDVVAGSVLTTSYQEITFTFSTPVSLTGSTAYGIGVYQDRDSTSTTAEVDVDNYLGIAFQESASGIATAPGMYGWTDGGTEQGGGYSTYTVSQEIWGMQ